MKSNLRINLSFFVILVIVFVNVINDIIYFFSRCNYLISLIISVIISTVLVVLLLKNKKIKIENSFNKFDLVFLIGFFIFTCIKIVIPDYYFDVTSYHYYKQEYFFTDSINYDFFPGGGMVNDFVYPLGDRMHYMFRYLLGLRLGTILSYYSAIIIYYEVKKIIKFLNPKIEPYFQAFGGICTLYVPIFYRYIGSYNIDILSVVFLLECYYIGISEKELFKEKKSLYYWFFISGCAIGVKISNLVLLIPIGINIIYNNISLFKELKLKDYIISIFMFIFPFVIYGINNYVQAGNFFYPFLGRKKYYDVTDWNDPNWGIPNFLYSFVWPILVAIFPRKGHDEEFLFEWIWLVGYLFLIISIICNIYKKNVKTDLFRNRILIFIFCIFWACFMNGYCRYASIIPMLFIINMISEINFFECKFKNFISVSVILLIVTVTYISMQYRR